MTWRLRDARRALWRRARRLWFVLFQRRRHDRLVLEHTGGRPLLVLPGVLNPVLFRTGLFLAETFDATPLSPQASVLDMGCGSGIGAIVAARRARRVVAVDINPSAVRCTRINAMLNGVEDSVEASVGDLFAPVRGERFDVVLFNPPFYRGVPRRGLEQALFATDVMERFADGLAGHLVSDGCALVVLSSDGDEAGCLDALRTRGLEVQQAASRDLRSEILTVYRVRVRALPPAAS